MMSAMTHWHLKRGPWTDEPRYYPPGQHPATAQMREQLAYAEGLLSKMRLRAVETGVEFDTTPTEEFIAYLKDKLAEFEARESELKARDAWIMRDREERGE
jgi:hypothetical protein